MIIIQTIGSVDLPGYGKRKMPAPGQYVALFITWLVLLFAAGLSEGAERAAAAFGWLLVLVGTVAGPFGQRLIHLFGAVSSNFAPSSSSTASTSSVPPGSVAT